MSSKNLPIVDWLQIDSSAPGKFIISGEYSVVYEKEAIAAAIDLRTRVVIRPNKDSKVRLNLKNLNTIREWPTSLLTTCRLVSKYSECLDYNEMIPNKLAYLLHPRYIVDQTVQEQPTNAAKVDDGDDDDDADDGQSSSNPNIETQKTEETIAIKSQHTKDWDKKAYDAVIAFLLLYIGLGDSYCSSARPPLEIEVESSVPVGSGLGSSSAYSVALCGGLMRVFRVAAEKYIISNWAFNVDKFFHGRPSGVDNNIVVMGGYILFQNGKIKATGVAHKAPIRVMLIDTCVSRSTKTLTENVRFQLSENAVRLNGIFNSINEITTQIWRKMNDHDFTPKNIADYLEANQQYLDSLGVGHEKLTDICAKARQYNLRAKQTGAGGGGTAFVLYDTSDGGESLDQLRELLIHSGYRVHDHDVGCEGLTVKIQPDPNKEFPTSYGAGDR